MPPKKKVSEVYQKYSQLDHILLRNDTYIGSVERAIEKHWVLDSDKTSMVYKEISFIPGLYKIFDEILVNAIDQTSVDPLVNKIGVTIDKENNTISVLNTGKGIPVVIHEKENVYIPQMIFGELLTSSNYDDSEKRTVGGRNGYGAKLANIFSSEFTIDIVDTENKKRYVQTWNNNMREKSEPKITAKNVELGYAKFTFKPDLKRFNMTYLEDDIIALFEKRVYDACACTPNNVQVYYNNCLLNFKNFEKYIDLYIGTKTETPRVFEATKRWEICICHSVDSFKQVSFVNGINTSQGGTHVEHITKQIVTKMSDKMKNSAMKPNFIKDHIFIFVKSTLENPCFSSQTKTECTLKPQNFGSKFEISDDLMKKISKLGIYDDALALAKHKELRELSKTDGKKRGTVKGIPKLNDANKAGSNKSKDCTLILTEGDSALATAIAGIGVVGRDYYGAFPLRGKLLNVREATAQQLLNNAEINNLKQILGLQQNKEYNDVSELRYGKIMILTDADVDGSHIKGLLINFFHYFWPSLLTHNFISAMITPVLKLTKNQQLLEFYSVTDYKNWTQNNSTQGWKIKYYKGLGTSTSAEAKDYFKNMNRNLIEYTDSNDTDNCIKLAFKKELADNRKYWIQEGITRNETLDYNTKTFGYNDFIHKDMIWFSIADLQRSIPSAIDGLKPSQRKILFAGRKRKNTEIKVSQFGAYVATETSYHHGEASLTGTIVSMSQNFVGSNNMNLLEPIGQFGTRLMGGKDAASPRYIFTQITKFAQNLFHNHDDPLLNYLDDDGKSIEPDYYIPVLPLVLINGAEGIGTGYSCSVPCYNPRDIIYNVKLAMENKPLKDMIPWYSNFKGKIEKTSEGHYVSHGIWTKINKNVIEITELPIGKWTQDYKEFLDSLIEKKLDSYENHCTESTVNFRLRMIQDKKFDPKDFRLTSNINTTNMHLFNHKNTISKYTSPLDIISEFTQLRLKFYKKRKKHLLEVLHNQLSVLENKVKFINMVIKKEIIIFAKKKIEVENILIESKFTKMNDSYDYLLNMKLYTLTLEQIEDLTKQLNNKNDEIKELNSKTEKCIMLNDINILEF